MFWITCSINERNRTIIMTIDQPQAPGPGRPVDQQKDLAILNAARELLFQQGPHAISVEAVAKKAGVSKVTVYARYANRDALITAAIRHQSETFSGFLPLPQTSLAEVRESLFNFSMSVLHFLASPEHLQFMRVLSAYAQAPEPMLQEIYAQGPATTLNELQQWLTALTAAGLLECENPQRSTEMLTGMLLRMDVIRHLHGFAIQYSEEELRQHADFVVTSFLRLHAAPET